MTKEQYNAVINKALETIQNLRHATATDFKNANAQGQRGQDRCDAFYDAYRAVEALKH